MGAYRDETETLRARVAELEREVAALRATTGGTHHTDWSSGAARVFGAPLTLIEERRIEAPLDDALLEEILDLLRTRFACVGTVTRTTAKGAITWQCGPPALNRVVEVTLKPDGASTKVRVVERLGPLVGGLFGGVVGGAGGGIGVGLGVPLMIELHRPALLFFTLPATLATVWLAVRMGVRSTARRREREILELLAEAAVLGATPKTRVADESEGESEREDERSERKSTRRA